MALEVRVAGKIRHSSVNGPGVRFVLFLQGCPHHCPGCQNPETHDVSGGTSEDTDDLTDEILGTKYLDGLTISGGDPLLQSQAVREIAGAARRSGLSVWVYTGWTYEQILMGKAGQDAIDALEFVDVLVDGPFVLEEMDEDLLFRGSRNQRLIDVQGSLKSGQVQLFSY